MNNFYVYLHKKKSDGEVFYVGKGKGNRAYDFTRRSRFWNSVEKIHGVDVCIFADGMSEEQAFNKEVELIKLYGRRQHGGSLVNLTNGGDGVSGKIWSDHERMIMAKRISGENNVSKRPDVRKKLSERFIGDKNPMKNPENSAKVSAKNTGKKASEETKRKMSDAHKGKTFSDESRKKMSVAKSGSNHPLFGKTLNDEYKKKISESMIGRVISAETRLKISLAMTGNLNKKKKINVHN